MRKAPASEGSGEAAPPCALDVPDNDTPEGRMHPLLALEEACGLAAGEWEGRGRMFRRDEITRDKATPGAAMIPTMPVNPPKTPSSRVRFAPEKQASLLKAATAPGFLPRNFVIRR